MTIQEVCNELRADCKPYALVKMCRHEYWNAMRRIQLGKAKPSTITKFFNTFGYTGKWDSWGKTNQS